MSFLSENSSEQNHERVSSILETVMAYARLDFSKKASLTGNGDALDAIGAGVNMLGEELESSTVSLKEKEHLLKEVHHRVKNNLQIVSSLLNLQSVNMLDRKYLALINDSRNRIHSMALVHEMLYASRDLSKIEIYEYITRLSSSINNSFSNPAAAISFHYHVQKNLFFDIDYMISIGLILNEIISNSFKYAFPDKTGNITISLSSQAHKGKQTLYELKVFDDGVGLSDNFDVKKDSQLGMQLISMLSDQINGTVNLTGKNGTTYTIIFQR
ncbi:MAG: hypothetical protein JNL60_19425 [Bacteroidia bacterium]|nr:hypothetical protein [Bacteroidia bacterium]